MTTDNTNAPENKTPRVTFDDWVRSLNRDQMIFWMDHYTSVIATARDQLVTAIETGATSETTLEYAIHAYETLCEKPIEQAPLSDAEINQIRRAFPDITPKGDAS